MGKINRTLIALAVGLMSSSAAVGNTPTHVERFLIDKGTEIRAKFDSSVPGLKGIVARTASGQQQLFYLLGDNYLLAGQVFDAQGVNITEKDLARVLDLDANAAVTPDKGKLESSYAAASSLNYIQDGAKGRVVYALFDPSCPYCHEFFRKSRAVVEQGLIQIRWLPVAILGNAAQRQENKGLIEAIYRASDKQSAMLAMTQRKLEGFPLSNEVNIALSENLLFMRDLPSRKVPTVIFESGGTVTMYDGLNNERFQHMITPQ